MPIFTNGREEGNWQLSGLAQKRAAQRNVDLKLLPLLLRYGKKLYLQGDMHVFLGKKMIPDGVLQDGALKRIQNTMVVVAQDGTVKTLWKDARTLKRIRQRKFRSKAFVQRRRSGRRKPLRRSRWRAPIEREQFRPSH